MRIIGESAVTAETGRLYDCWKTKQGDYTHTMSSVVELTEGHGVFKTPGVRFSVSSRNIRPDIDIEAYIKIFYMYTDFASIDSVFGSTTEPSKLYGGRPFLVKRSLTQKHLEQLEELGIHLSLTLTNHFFDDTSYRESRALLKRHHKKGNSIICVNDQLAERLRNDFPDYLLKAGIIKNICTLEQVEENLALYHQIVLPMDLNDNDLFLLGIREEYRPRIVLFGNATCAYTCPNRTCYLGYSQQNAGLKKTAGCSRKTVPRLDVGDVWFDIGKLKNMGYIHFKLVPLAPASAANVAARYSKKKTFATEQS